MKIEIFTMFQYRIRAMYPTGFEAIMIHIEPQLTLRDRHFFQSREEDTVTGAFGLGISTLPHFASDSSSSTYFSSLISHILFNSASVPYNTDTNIRSPFKSGSE